MLVVVAGPSGAGKTTLARHIVRSVPRTRFSVSCTTRGRRDGETQDQDYHFLDEGEFERLIGEGHFLEWARVHGELYGTPAQWVRDRLHEGINVVLDIDVQGALQVREGHPSAVLVFVLPPSVQELRRRLVDRGTDSDPEIERRMTTAAREVGWAPVFDYLVENDDLDMARQRMESIVVSEGLRTDRTPVERLLEYEQRAEGRDYWSGVRAVVTAGPTREPLDDVRFLGNRSSGLMGICMAMALRDAGAEVTLVCGPTAYRLPDGMALVAVRTTEDLLREMGRVVPQADFLAMAAAVSDFRPERVAEGKSERSQGPLDLRLKPTPDVLVELSPRCPVLAFALEMGENAESRAKRKMRSKRAVAIFVNRGDVPGVGMESVGNEGVLLFESGRRVEVPRSSKRMVAERIACEVGLYLRDDDVGQA